MIGLLFAYWRYMAVLSLASAVMATATPIGASVRSAGAGVVAAAKAPLDSLENLGASLSPDASEKVKVSRVVDGDTFMAQFGDNTRRVRILQVDTPESVKPDTPVQCYAKKASSFTKHKLTGKNVTLVYSRDRDDKYGRVLAYVKLDGHDFGARLLRGGYARVLTIAPNTERTDQYQALEDRAHRDRRGLWGACE